MSGAHQAKQESPSIPELDQVNYIGYADGSNAKGSVSLNNASSWFAVPSSPPSVPYLLVVSKETENGTYRVSSDGSGTPGSANGNKWWGNELSIQVGAGKSIYLSSSSTSDVVNYFTIELE